MKKILEEWDGTYEVDGEEKEDLQDVDLQDGQEFHIRLIPERREQNND